MRKIHIFLFILIITLAALITIALVSWYLSAVTPSYYGSSWMNQMWSGMGLGNYGSSGTGGNYGGMGGMMGNGSNYGTAPTTTTSYLWIIPVILIGVVAAAIMGVGFYLYFPELKYIRAKGACNTPNMQAVPSVANANSTSLPTNASPAANVSPPVVNSPIGSSSVSAPNNCEVLLKTMTPEEQKVMGVLINHKGKYLQKYVVKESGLSRLKTHRIVARFALRGIVTVKEFGNTNEIVLSDWVTNANAASPL